MAQEEENETTPAAAPDDAYTRTEAFIEKYKKAIAGIIILLVAGVAAYFGYQQLYLKPMDQTASAEMWKAEYYFGVDSLELAAKGDRAGYDGFKDIVEDYGGTQAESISRYYLAVSHLQMGNYKKAVTHAEEVETKNEFVAALAQGVAGEGYVEMGKHEEGVARFRKAISRSDNGLTQPLYLKKAGIVLEKLGRYEEALKLYEQIRDEHPGSEEGKDIEKYIARAESYV